jgi:hypothetical protein
MKTGVRFLRGVFTAQIGSKSPCMSRNRATISNLIFEIVLRLAS